MSHVVNPVATMTDRAGHWERLYTEQQPSEVSWYQVEPALSLELIAATGIGPDGRLIDVGGGASVLVDRLVARGYRHVTVLDISPTALHRAQERLGPAAAQVTWRTGDITAVDLPPAAFDVWHDRAVFHFLTDADDRRAYVRAAAKALGVGGHLVVATFAIEGPPRCSGLEVVRYSPETLQETFQPSFELVEARQELHTTPRQRSQAFVYVRFRRRA